MSQISHTNAIDTGSRLAELEAENERLRARLAALDQELLEIQARANAAVGEWQGRAEMLDQWHLDLNKAVKRPGVRQLLSALRAIRSVFWRVKRLKRRLWQR